jgi:hypothetical protein
MWLNTYKSWLKLRLVRQILIVPIPYILIDWLGSLLLKHVVNNQDPTLQNWESNREDLLLTWLNEQPTSPNSNIHLPSNIWYYRLYLRLLSFIILSNR